MGILEVSVGAKYRISERVQNGVRDIWEREAMDEGFGMLPRSKGKDMATCFICLAAFVG